MLNETSENLGTEQTYSPIDDGGNTPPFIVDMLHNPPILPGESKEEFLDIYQSYVLMEEGDAFTPIEFMLAWRATVLTYEVVRYERMKIAILRNQHRPATESLLKRTGGFFSTGPGVDAMTSKLADEYYAKSACKAKSDKQFEGAGFAPDAVEGEAFLRALSSLSSIEKLIASAEKRLLSFNKELETRYSARAEKFKANATKVIETAITSAASKQE
jgi:hypothetical protein